MLSHKFIHQFAIAIALGVVLITGFSLHPARVSAAPDGLTMDVNDTADLPDSAPGDGNCMTANATCTLRAAVMEANKHKGTDVIRLAANTTYQLTRAGEDNNALNGDLDIKESINLIGNDATIDANSTVTHDRALHFVFTKKQQLSMIEHLTITGGSTTASGGGIWNQSFIFLKEVRVNNNHADAQGGGIANDSQLVMFGSTIEYNNCTCASDQQPGGGGAVNHDTVILFQSTVNNNTSHFDGGGIWDDGKSTSILASTFANNVAARNGGAIYNKDAAVMIAHSTIAANFADADHDNVGYGGGIYNEPSGTVALGHTLLAKNGNVASFLWTWDDCHGALDSFGYNLIYYNNLCVVSASKNLNGFEPSLDTFGDHGGPTKTYSLKAGSWAIDNGDPNGCKFSNSLVLPYDQRTYQRIVDGSGDNVAICDIGAFEVGAAPYVTCPDKPTKPVISTPTPAGKQVWLTFSTDCADTYKVVIRRDAKKGPVADRVRGLGMPFYLTETLPSGHTYWARVTACNPHGCIRSAPLMFTK